MDYAKPIILRIPQIVCIEEIFQTIWNNEN